MNKTVESILGIEVLKYESWDDISIGISQYYGIEWMLEELKQYNGRITVIDLNSGLITIYKEDEQTLDVEIDIKTVTSFREKLLESSGK